MADVHLLMPDGTYELWVDTGGGILVRGTSLGTLLYGENETKGRMDVDFKPDDTDSIQELLQDAATSTGTGTPINVKGFKSISFRVNATSGTWNGGFQATINDTDWYYIQVVPQDTRSAINGGSTQFNPSSATVDAQYDIGAINPAWSQIRFNIAARTSGTIIVQSRKHPR